MRRVQFKWLIDSSGAHMTGRRSIPTMGCATFRLHQRKWTQDGWYTFIFIIGRVIKDLVDGWSNAYPKFKHQYGGTVSSGFRADHQIIMVLHCDHWVVSRGGECALSGGDSPSACRVAFGFACESFRKMESKRALQQHPLAQWKQFQVDSTFQSRRKTIRWERIRYFWCPEERNRCVKLR
jgi:hypothetical protein